MILSGPTASGNRGGFIFIMKIPLKFNLLPLVEGTDIAETYSLKNDGEGNHTIVDLETKDRRVLIQELTELAVEIQQQANEAQRQLRRKHTMPVGGKDTSGPMQKLTNLRERHRLVRSAVTTLSKNLPPPPRE